MVKKGVIAGVWLRSSPTHRYGLSVDDQKNEIEKMAYRDGVKIVKYWTDSDSGEIHPDKNRYFLTMKENIRKDPGFIKILYVYDKARFGLVDSAGEIRINEFFAKNNIELKYLNERLIPVGAICRRSTDMQEASLDVQMDSILEYATKDNCEVRKWWLFGEEKGQSGVSIERCQDWKNMLDELKNSMYSIERILVDDVSRIGRTSPNRKIYIQELFKEYKAPIYYINAPFKDDGSLEDGVMQFVRHGEAFQSSKEKSKNVKTRSLVYARKGFWLAGNIYAYKRLVLDEHGNPFVTNGKNLILEKKQSKQVKTQRIKLIPGNSEEIKVVRRVYAMYNDDDIGFYTIAARLNAEEIPAARGGTWTPTVVRSLLTNEIYVGTSHYNRQTTDIWSGITTKVPKEEQVKVENAHEGIISKELFFAVQEKIKKNSNRFKTGHHPNTLKDTPKFPLIGTIFCLDCQRRYASAWAVRKSNRRGKYVQAYYKDTSRRTFGKKVCPNSISLRKDDIDALVMNRIKERLMSGVIIQKVKNELKKKLDSLVSSKKTDGSKIKIEAELNEIESKIENLLNVIARKGMSNQVIDKIQTELDQLISKKKIVEKNLGNIESSDTVCVDINKLTEKIMDNYKKVIDKLENGQFSSQRRIVRELIHSIAVSPTKKVIYIAYYDLPEDIVTDMHLDGSAIPEPLYNRVGPINIKEEFYMGCIQIDEHMYEDVKPLTCFKL
ncbi:MAG: hypothetical protein A2252_01540 [Elusimicrobia bacterium RIFOXYA2_FULL_39_19]|nr:MAG: hypothetical protein A2252_01540 [Elusimicrobia bacterium RIFOXYA2_FULL_39_19]